MQLNVLAASHIIGIRRGVDIQSSILTSLTGDKVGLSVVGEQALGVDGEAGGGLGSSITLELGGRSYQYLLGRCLSVRSESRYSRVKIHPRPWPSMIPPSELMQNSPSGRLPKTRFCPSSSWPMGPEAPPEAARWKQQVLSLVTRALAPTARAAREAKFFVL